MKRWRWKSLQLADPDSQLGEQCQTLWMKRWRWKSLQVADPDSQLGEQCQTLWMKRWRWKSLQVADPDSQLGEQCQTLWMKRWRWKSLQLAYPGGPTPYETASPPALKLEELNSSFHFPIHCVLCFSVFHCYFFLCLSALPAHSSVLFKAVNQYHYSESECDYLNIGQMVTHLKISPLDKSSAWGRRRREKE